MKVREAVALCSRISADTSPAVEAVDDALRLLQNGLIMPAGPSHPDNRIYAGEGAGNVVLQVEQALNEASRRLGVLKRSVEVCATAIYEARQQEKEPWREGQPVSMVSWALWIDGLPRSVDGPDGMSEHAEGSELDKQTEQFAADCARSAVGAGQANVKLYRTVREVRDVV